MEAQILVNKIRMEIENKYKILESLPIIKNSFFRKIGFGTFSEVYLGVFENTPCVFKKTVVGEEDSFITEMKILQEIQHPNIIKLLGVGKKDLPVLILEYFYMDLYAYMKKGYLIQKNIKTIMFQLFQAVACIHKKGFIHTDIKPHNILIYDSCFLKSAKEEKITIKLCDFGSAHKNPISGIDYDVTTLWYRAPETLLCYSKLTQAIDIWAIGCVFLELLCKRPFFDGTCDSEQLIKYCKVLGAPSEEKNTDPHRYWKQDNKVFNGFRGKIPRGLNLSDKNAQNLVYRMLTYDPERRITAEEALEHSYFKE